MKKYDTKVRFKKQGLCVDTVNTCLRTCKSSYANIWRGITVYIVILCLICGNLNIVALANETNTEEIIDTATTEAESEVDEADDEETTKDETIRAVGYIEDDFIIPSITDASENSSNSYSDSAYETKSFAATYSSNALEVIPTSYSSKEILPSVRDQGSFGVCWSFAALGMAEASLISKGMADKTIDLSELQLAYFFYHSVTDPLGNTLGDKNELLQGNYLNMGGNNVFTTFALANWVGAADEAKAPYHTASVSKSLESALAYDDAYHMQNAYWINMAADTAEVKKMIMEYGAVASAFYTDQTSSTASTACYNASTYSYYYNGTYATNHAIAIVGWDDNYDRANFNTAKQPVSDGAWFIRNSWGEGMGEDGYFWISYEDSAFTSQNYSKAFVYDFEPGDNYDHNYQYDGASGICQYPLSSGGSIANIFTATGNMEGEQEKIEAISFALYDVNVNYSIQIYTDLTGDTDPTSGTKAFAAEQTGSTTYVGYYTIPLNEKVMVDEGEKFSVVVTLSKSNSEETYFFVDYSYQNGDWIAFTNTTAKGQSFRKNSSGSNWTDMNSAGLTARIKAFTTNVVMQEETNSIINATGITLNQNSLQLNVGESAVLSATVLPENASDQSITWVASDSSIATVTSDGIVTALNKGTTMITVSTVNGLTAMCQITVNEVVKKEVTNSEVEVTDSEIEVTAAGIVIVTVQVGKVANLKALSQNTSSIRIGWDKQYGVSGYEIYRYDSAKKKYIKIATNSKESKVTYTDKKKESATTYKYKVRAYVKKNGKKVYGAYSAVLTTTTKTTKPVLNIRSSNKKAKLSWNKVKGATGYEIVMSTKKTKGFTKVKTITKGKTIAYTKKKLKKGVTYYFKIRAYKMVKGIKIYSSYSKVTAVKIK